jgi:DNA-binding XRE family transcriptional regulator
MTRAQTYQAEQHEQWLAQRAQETHWIFEEAVSRVAEGATSERQALDYLNSYLPEDHRFSRTGFRKMLNRANVDIRHRDTAPRGAAVVFADGRSSVRFRNIHPIDVRVGLPAEYDRLLRVVENASAQLRPEDLRRLVRVLMWQTPSAEQERADWGKPLPSATTLADAVDGGLRVRRSTVHHGSGPWKQITVAELARRAGMSDQRVLQRNLSGSGSEPLWSVWDQVLEVLGWYVEIVTDPTTKMGWGARLPSDPVALGQVLAQHRMDPHQWTQAAVAKAIGIARGTYVALEAGKRPTKYATVAAALGKFGGICRIAPVLSAEAEEQLRQAQHDEAMEAERLASLQRYPPRAVR